MQNLTSSAAKINANIYREHGGINPTIMLLMASTYDNLRFISNIAAHLMPLNHYLAHNYEIKARMVQVRHLRHVANLCARTLRLGKESIAQYCLGTGGALLAGAIENTHAILQMQRIIEVKQSRPQMISDVPGNITAVKKHEYNDMLPLYVSPMDYKTSVFEPRTIHRIKGMSGGKKVAIALKSQMEEYLSMSLEGRAHYLDYYTDVREITKKDCKKDKLDSIMVGQRGVFAKRKIPANTLIGFYSGTYCATEFEVRKAQRDIGFDNMNTYVFGFGKQALPRINAFNTGNRLSLINASTCYSGTLNTVARDIAHKTNIIIGYARSGENTYADIRTNPESFDLVFFCTSGDILPEQQLFVDYGQQYWKNKVQNYIEATNNELNKAVKDFRNKKKKAKLRKIR